MKIAFVYDRINKFGGAERVLQVLHQIWPKAPIYTAVHNPKTSSWTKDISIKPSFLQKFPLAKTHHELYPWLTPLAFESFDFTDYDVVISITSAEAKAIITKPDTFHICYCLTPTRYLWSHQQDYQINPSLGIWNNIARPVFKNIKKYLQKSDLIASSRPDVYIAISQAVQKRIKQYYHRSSVIIHPPVNIKKFSKAAKISKKSKSKYYLLVSRLTSYKKIDLAIKTFNKLKKNLIIVGEGREEKNLKKIAGSTIFFITKIKDSQLVNLYQHCQALIMPQEEDFGITAVEAMSVGKPVIAFNKGGVLDTVIHKQTGILFPAQTVDSLSLAVKQFTISSAWDSKAIKVQAKKFDQQIFKNKIKIFVEEQWQNKKKSR